jgi:hypothetical protein
MDVLRERWDFNGARNKNAAFDIKLIALFQYEVGL